MKSIELFAGIGGIALAAEWAGIETVAFCERDSFCQKVLKKHWPDVPIFDDIRTLDKSALEERDVDIGAVELVSGGYPCQPFSHAGKRGGEEDDRHLWPEMFRLVRELRPTWVVGENVAGHISLGLDNVLADLESEGYQARAFVLPALAVGAPHRRDRVFVVAHSNRIRNYISEECQTNRNRQKENEERGQPQSGLGDKSEGAANSESERCRKTREYQSKRSEERTSSSSEIVGNTDSIKLQRNWAGRIEIMESRYREKEFKGSSYGGGGQWATEPDVGRVAHGVPNRMDRLRSLGNAVVPHQIYPIFKAIMEIG